MNRSRSTKLIGVSRPAASETKDKESDTAGYERKIRSLLDTNRLLARENQYLLHQGCLLRKEHDALGHLMRSRIALSNVKEMELKSALEGMRLVVQEKEKSIISLERKYQELLTRMKSLEREEKNTRIKPKSTSSRKSYGIRRLSKQFTHVSPEEKHQEAHECQSPTPEGMTEAYHPWLSPVLMRLEALENDRGPSFQGLCRTTFSTMQELDETTAAPETLQFCGLDDAISCTGDCHTPNPRDGNEKVSLSEKANDIEYVSRYVTNCGLSCCYSVIQSNWWPLMFTVGLKYLSVRQSQQYARLQGEKMSSTMRCQV